MNKHIATAAAVFGGIVAAGILVACGGGSTAAQDAAHPTATVTAPAVTTTVKVPTVPQACLDALDDADTGFTYAGTALGAASDGFTAASLGNTSGLELATKTMDETTPKLTALAPQYNAAKAECRAAAGN